MAERALPFLPGQRVRCLVSTLDRNTWPQPVELRGRVGVVAEVYWLSLEARPGYWVVLVRYDLGAPNLPWHHTADELELAGLGR